MLEKVEKEANLEDLEYLVQTNLLSFTILWRA
jgi:hypothetical protein